MNEWSSCQTHFTVHRMLFVENSRGTVRGRITKYIYSTSLEIYGHIARSE